MLDFEQLIGLLFALYILGSMVAGFFRRGRSGGRGRPTGPARPGLPDVLDMDELERRLRELAGERVEEYDPSEAPASREPGKPEPRPELTPPVTSAPPSPPRPAMPPMTPAGPRPAPVTRLPREDMRPLRDDDFEGWQDDETDWARWARGEEAFPARASDAKRPDAVPGLPPVVAAYMRQGKPWQAAVVVKEILGPPRAFARRRSGFLR